MLIYRDVSEQSILKYYSVLHITRAHDTNRFRIWLRCGILENIRKTVRL